MPFNKGKSGNPKGRGKGTPNKLTKTVRETVLAVFNDLQSDPKANLFKWAKDNPRDFYQIAAKLIPTELVGKEGESLQQSTTIINVMSTDHAEKMKHIEERLNER